MQNPNIITQSISIFLDFLNKPKFLLLCIPLIFLLGALNPLLTFTLFISWDKPSFMLLTVISIITLLIYATRLHSFLLKEAQITLSQEIKTKTKTPDSNLKSNQLENVALKEKKSNNEQTLSANNSSGAIFLLIVLVVFIATIIPALTYTPVTIFGAFFGDFIKLGLILTSIATTIAVFFLGLPFVFGIKSQKKKSRTHTQSTKKNHNRKTLTDEHQEKNTPAYSSRHDDSIPSPIVKLTLSIIPLIATLLLCNLITDGALYIGKEQPVKYILLLFFSSGASVFWIVSMSVISSSLHYGYYTKPESINQKTYPFTPIDITVKSTIIALLLILSMLSFYLITSESKVNKGTHNLKGDIARNQNSYEVVMKRSQKHKINTNKPREAVNLLDDYLRVRRNFEYIIGETRLQKVQNLDATALQKKVDILTDTYHKDLNKIYTFFIENWDDEVFRYNSLPTFISLVQKHPKFDYTQKNGEVYKDNYEHHLMLTNTLIDGLVNKPSDWYFMDKTHLYKKIKAHPRDDDTIKRRQKLFDLYESKSKKAMEIKKIHFKILGFKYREEKITDKSDEILKRLDKEILEGFDINSLGQYGQTLISYTLNHGSYNLIKELVARGANINLNHQNGLIRIVKHNDIQLLEKALHKKVNICKSPIKMVYYNYRNKSAYIALKNYLNNCTINKSERDIEGMRHFVENYQH